mmetsp:Transcript_139920/g.363696  ORF Transcript_139920/g.363696 Transcript_139920/m.363696 type:complete len:754 (-) Transcript_139920:263-2524(-)
MVVGGTDLCRRAVFVEPRETSRPVRVLSTFANFSHNRKVEILAALLVIGVLHDSLFIFAPEHTHLSTIAFAPLEIGLGAMVVMSSISTLVLMDQQLLGKRSGDQIAQRRAHYPNGRALDFALDASVGTLLVVSHAEGLFSLLDLGHSSCSMSNILWYVACRLLSTSWIAFALAVYCPIRDTVPAASLDRMLPRSKMSQRTFAFVQIAVSSTFARVLRGLIACVCFCAVGIMIKDLMAHVSECSNAHPEALNGDRARTIAIVLCVCNVLQLLLELGRPMVLSNELRIFPAISILFSMFCVAATLVLILQSMSSSFQASFALAAFAQYLTSYFVLLLMMRKVARKVRREINGKGAEFVTRASTLLTRYSSVASKATLKSSRDVAGDVIGAPHPSAPLAGCEMARPLRILCIDGGGIRGIVSALILEAIEQRCGRPACELFDLVCGTSIGSCIALTAVCGVKSSLAAERLDGMRDAVFARSSPWRLLRTGSRIAEESIDSYLDTFLGNWGIGESDPAPAIGSNNKASSFPHYFSVCAAEHQDECEHTWLPFIVSNYERASPSFVTLGAHGWAAKAQLRASCAAPTYFPPYIEKHSGASYVDGAVVANNPSMIALQEARALWPGRPIGCLVSIGTGQCGARQSSGDVLYWAGKLMSMPIETGRTHKEVEAALRVYNPPHVDQPSYFRLNPVIRSVEIDEYRAAVIQEMAQQTAQYLERINPELDCMKDVLADQIDGAEDVIIDGFDCVEDVIMHAAI